MAFIVAVLLFKIRMMMVRLAATGPTLFAIVQQDAAIFMLLLLVYEVGRIAARRDSGRVAGRAAKAILARLCMVVCLLVVLLHTGDAFAYCFFDRRLHAGDIVAFVSEPGSALSLWRPGWQGVSDLSAKRLGIFAVVTLLMLRACYTLLVSLGRRSEGVRGNHTTSLKKLKAKEQQQTALTQINVVENWFEDLKRRVSIGTK